MKIYTKTGDRGETGLFGGARVSKSSLRVRAYGDVDELNSVLGLCRAHDDDPFTDKILHSTQSHLFALGAELASVPDKDVDVGVALLQEKDVQRLEGHIDVLEKDLAPLKTFVLPGGTPSASFLHIGRTTCRRAERTLVELSAAEPVRDELVRYLNRLSDLLFVMARHANHRANVEDVPWLGRHGE